MISLAAFTTAEAEMPNMSSNSSHLPERGTLVTARNHEYILLNEAALQNYTLHFAKKASGQYSFMLQRLSHFTEVVIRYTRVMVLHHNDAASTLLSIGDDGLLVNGLNGEQVHHTHIGALSFQPVSSSHCLTQCDGSTNNQYLMTAVPGREVLMKQIPGVLAANSQARSVDTASDG
ncbi:hypothetical protein E2C01_037141 [Portunus trituberculatus]|uniref:Uncharacterized protein n=1 Tax=Portunus trituberculatus TaxID=210409 RepID=A0A5B7FAL3_PORTR|nr:hypothetical protein [Portunus trituberculatus]